jgi:hypothetical protein
MKKGLKMLKWALLLNFVLVSIAQASLWEEITYSGQIGFSYRQFEGDKNTKNEDHQQDTYAKISAGLEQDNSKIHFSAFGRIDSVDSTRNIFNIDEGYYKYTKDLWSFSIGNHIFNWSVLEMFHPVDSINARNLDTNAVAAERLGQPAIVITREFERSILQFISLLQTVSPVIPSAKNRNGPQVYLEAPRFIDDDFSTTNSPNIPEGIVHYLHNFDSFDLDLHVARKYDTLNPVIGSTYPTVEKVQATPYYLPVTQYGVAIQGAYDKFMLKFEHIYYDFENYKVCTFINCVNYYSTKEDHSLTAFGTEYSTVYKNDQEGTFFLEYQTVLGTTIEEARVLNVFQRDIGFGYRHNFNNFDGHEIIAVVIGDLDQLHEQIYNISHSFRLSESWKWHSELRIVKAVKPSEELELDNFSGLKPISESDNIFFRLTKFF